MLRRFRRNPVGALSLLMTAACAPPGAKKGLPREAAKMLAKLEALDGKSGEFEGVYKPGLHEGSSFEFCTEYECPDMQELDCYPEFSEQAAGGAGRPPRY